MQSYELRKDTHSMWTTCGEGHDLTAPNAYVYTGNGTRQCRECANKTASPKKLRQRGSFNGSTWAEKRGENLVRKV